MQLELFAPPPPLPKKPQGKRTAFTWADIRFIRDNYTTGLLSGKETAKKLKRTYGSLKNFLIRNPDLMKRGKRRN